MTALRVLTGCAALLLTALLFLPAAVRIRYDGDSVKADARILLVTVPLIPSGEKPEKGRPESGKRNARPLSFPDLLQLLNDFLPRWRDILRQLAWSLVLRRCRVTLLVAGDDAAETGLRCGKAWFLIHTLRAFLGRHIRIREWAFDVRQDYLSGRSAERISADLELRVAPAALLRAGFRLFFRGGVCAVRFPKSAVERIG